MAVLRNWTVYTAFTSIYPLQLDVLIFVSDDSFGGGAFNAGASRGRAFNEGACCAGALSGRALNGGAG